MRVLGALAAWFLSGGIFGAAGAIVWANLGCAPSGTLKPFLTAVSAALFSTEAAILALLAGGMVYVVFRKALHGREAFRTHLVISSGLGSILLLLFAIAVYFTAPNWNCTLPQYA
jgi:hypothetical protein